MPEMSEENYTALLERIDSQDKTIEALNKRLTDLAAMNKALMRTTDIPPKSASDRHHDLEAKLMKGIVK